ncbi:GNAT family N-acetyltransferase [Bacillus tianshenii]|uniref:GNAT family N-acetyltransferase n=1 Tax=Sutcliffiella tianshenii TaxID=1463404 RepID=UPI001CD38B9B|nr:GNAT family N-acetyltransferase [Bacillus tianshenii]MCA1321861.1 GNAT family N-acetyltransferase [Bacillus tianshenii]
MIVELLKVQDINGISAFLDGHKVSRHPIIMGVLSGQQIGFAFIDNQANPKMLVVYAVHEMIYLIGDIEEESFEEWFQAELLPIARSHREEDINIETYPQKEELEMKSIFQVIPIKQGTRVAFTFSEEAYISSYKKNTLPEDYSVAIIDRSILQKDKNNILSDEILKFWHSTDQFIENGLGVAAFYKENIIGACLSVYQHNGIKEIGINNYNTSHRGKGIASAMANLFIEECLKRGETPSWTTELFRKDSIAIARKLGFINERIYPSYYFLLEEA